MSTDQAKEQQFLQVIRDDPDDDVVRLDFANWLEDHGSAARAELIRVQCEIARLPFDDDRVSALQAHEYRLIARHYSEFTQGSVDLSLHRGLGETFRYFYLDRFHEYSSVIAKNAIRHLELVCWEDDELGDLAQWNGLAFIESLQFSGRFCDECIDSDAAYALLASRHLKRLKCLRPMLGTAFTDDLVFKILGHSEHPSLFPGVDVLLPSLSRLRRLSLGGTSITDTGLQAILESPLAETLTDLDLGEWDGLTSNSISMLIASPLWSRLRALRLAPFRFLDIPLLPLIEALPDSRITHLGLQRMLPAGCEGDMRALFQQSGWKQIEGLDLSLNFLSDALLSFCKCPYLTSLRDLDLSANNLTDTHLEWLANTPELSHLHTLQLSDHILEDSALHALVTSPNLNNLIHLSIQESSFSAQAITAFLHCTNAARLRELQLSGDFDDTTMEKMLLSPHLTQLVRFSIPTSGGRRYPGPTSGGQPYRLTDQGAMAIADCTALPNLALLDFNWSELTEKGLAALTECQRLAGFSRLQIREDLRKKVSHLEWRDPALPSGNAAFRKDRNFPWSYKSKEE